MPWVFSEKESYALSFSLRRKICLDFLSRERKLCPEILPEFLPWERKLCPEFFPKKKDLPWFFVQRKKAMPWDFAWVFPEKESYALSFFPKKKVLPWHLSGIRNLRSLDSLWAWDSTYCSGWLNCWQTRTCRLLQNISRGKKYFIINNTCSWFSRCKFNLAST